MFRFVLYGVAPLQLLRRGRVQSFGETLYIHSRAYDIIKEWVSQQGQGLPLGVRIWVFFYGPLVTDCMPYGLGH